VRPLRLSEEKKKIEDRKKPQDENIMVYFHRATMLYYSIVNSILQLNNKLKISSFNVSYR